MVAGLAESEIRFRDIAQSAGIDLPVHNCQTPNRYQIEPMIAGAAVFDYNNDGLLDIYVCNGAQIPDLQKTGPDFFNRLYKNAGDLRFIDVTENAGVTGVGYSMGVSVGDYDNDGWSDLYVTGVNHNTLYRNLRDGTFRDVTRQAGVSGYLPGHGKAWSVAAGWFDYDIDGDLDLFVVNYCVWAIDKDRYCGARKPGYRTYCHPKYYDPLPNILYRNEGDGRFKNVSNESGINRHVGKGMGVAIADFEWDGDLDVFISNDAWRNFLFRNQGDGRFEEIGLYAGVSYVDNGRPVSGMGADTGDYNGDGLIDIFMTALSNETFPLFRNSGNGMFRDERFPSGLGVQTLAWGGWSLGMVDLDNDGWLDLFTAGGHVQTNEELYTSRSSRQSNRVFRNLGDGRFQDVTLEVGADFQQIGLHRAAAFGDLDNDGRIDAVVTRLNENLEIFHNESPSPGHFLLLDLEGTRSNRDAIGTTAWLTLESGRQLVRQSKTAVGYGSSSDRRIHFGLGTHRKVKSLELIWPSGKRHLINDVEIDRVLHLREPEN
jgi:hypothetical protein